MDIAVINTGGTISCVGNPLAPMTAEAFAEACVRLLNPVLVQDFPNLRLTYVTDLVFPNSTTGTLDSTNLQPSDWCRIAEHILTHYARYDGWVVLHGTDSLDFTGAALPFLLSVFDADGRAKALLTKPVVLTGSQVPMFYQADPAAPLMLKFNTDAFQNICGAIAAAQTGIPEVTVYFGSYLFRANRVRKTDANEFNAFSSPNYPPLGRHGITMTLTSAHMLPPPVSAAVGLDDPGALALAREQVGAIAAVIDEIAVMKFSAFPARYNPAAGTALLADLLNACIGRGLQGLVLQSYGEGNFPSGNPGRPQEGAVYKALEAANKAGIIVIDNTQVPQGVVDNNAYAAGAWLPEVGVLSPVDMTPMASFAKLTVLLAARTARGWTYDDVKRLMQTSLLGEMRSVNRLDSRLDNMLLPGQSIVALDGSATLKNDPFHGPRLVDSTGVILWAALPSPAPAAMPGRLVLEADGTLVFRGRTSVRLWTSETSGSTGAGALLRLDGSASAGDLSLDVCDHASGPILATLYRA